MTKGLLLQCSGPATALLVALAPTILHGQETEGVSVEYEVGLGSDYRDRGYSNSDEKPALQAGVVASVKARF